jgi:hypothetical protein
MWKKLFYDASKRFSNDVSNIVGNELKKKAKQQNKQDMIVEDIGKRESAIYINRLKHNLIQGKKDIEYASEIISSLDEIDKSDIDFELINIFANKISDKKVIIEEIQEELNNLWDIGEELGTRYGDYTVKFSSKAVGDIYFDIWILFIGIMNIITEFENAPFDKLDYEKGLLEFYKSAEELIIKIDEQLNDLTNKNIVRTYFSDGRTQTIDYNN